MRKHAWVARRSYCCTYYMPRKKCIPAKPASPVMLDYMLRPLPSPCNSPGVSNAAYVTEACTCSRPNYTILCKVCGFLTTGRLKMICPQHPKTHFLMDVNRCPKCLAYPFMMQEISTEVTAEKNFPLE